MAEDCNALSTPEGEYELSGCGTKYRAGVLKLPERGWTLSPWVKLTLKRSGSIITVGNESCPSTMHNAIIKEFEFGQTDGFTMRIVIHDQQGSNFVQFMKDLIKDFKLLVPSGALTMEVRWGWVKSGCAEPVPWAASPCHIVMPDNIECNFSQGKFIFEITAKDLPYRMMEARIEKAKGQDDKPMRLKHALVKMLTDTKEKPAISSVAFLRMEGSGPQPCDFEKWPDGPEGTWVPEGRDKLHTAEAWIKDWRTDRLKGWTMAYDSTKDQVIFWEDSKPKCGEAKDWDSMCIGTYIVNGGKRSPVIEFNPKIRWDFASLVNAGGGVKEGEPMLNANTEHVGHVSGRLPCDIQRIEDVNHTAGIAVNIANNRNSKDILGKKAEDHNQLAVEKHLRANKLLHQNIQVDMVIVGDPTLLPPSEGIWTRNVAIVFINPYHLMIGRGGAGNGMNASCGEWLALPVCNEVLSNKAWVCNKITHKITPGHYTTTLGLFLTASGIDINTCEPIGGEGSMGWKPC